MKRELVRVASYKRRKLSHAKLEVAINSRRTTVVSSGYELFEGGRLTARFQEMVDGLIQERRELYERLAGGA